MRSYLSRIGLTTIWCPYKKKRRDKKTSTHGEHHVMKEAEIEVTPVGVKE